MSLDYSSSITIITAFVFLTISLVLIFFAVRSALQADGQIEQRLAGVEGGGALVPDAKGHSKILETLGNHLTLPGPDEIKRIRYELAHAGFYSASAVKVFFSVRVISLLVPQFGFLLFWGQISNHLEPLTVVFAAFAVATLSLFAPTWFLRWRKSKRTLQARNGFPDMMDLLVASVEAGLGLDAALLRVTDEIGARYPVLKINLDLMNMELRAGRARQEAMITFADRINLEEAKALAVILRQSEEMGSSLGAALRTFSDEMRTRRMLKAEEKAMALSAKLTVPLIFFIFPAIMVMLMLPSGVRLAQGMG